MSIPLSTGASILLKQLVNAYCDAEQREVPEQKRIFHAWKDGLHLQTFITPPVDSVRIETTEDCLRELRSLDLIRATKPGGPIYMLTSRGRTR